MLESIPQGFGQTSRITPHKVVLAALVRLYCDGHSEILPETKRSLAVFLVDQIKTSDECQEPALPALVTSIRKEVFRGGESVVPKLVIQLNDFCSPNDVFNFFGEAQSLVGVDTTTTAGGEQLLHPASVFGIFIRRLTLEFNKSAFDGLSRLFSDLQKYLDIQNGGASFSMSKTQLQHYAHKKTSSFHKFNDSPGKSLDDEIDTVESVAGDHKASFLRYLNCLRNNEFEGAIESVHRYFDNPKALEGAEGEALLGPGRSSCQYSALALAAAHFHFGMFEEAKQAILETVRIAQLNNDHACLAHALSWLCKLVGQEGDRSQERQLLQLCLSRAGGLDLHSVSGQGALSLATLMMNTMSGVEEHAPQPHMQVRSHNKLPTQVWGSVHEGKKVCVNSNIQGLYGSCLLVSGGCWELFGQRMLAELSIEKHLSLYGRDGGVDDTCLSFAKIALHKASSGDIDGAIEYLDRTASRLPPLAENKTWKIVTNQILFEQSILLNDFEKAEKMVCRLAALCPENTSAAASVGVSCLRARLFTARGAYTDGLSVLNAAVATCVDRGLELQKVECYIALAELHLKAGSPLTALRHCLNSVSLCENNDFMELQASATTALSRALLELGHVESSRRLLEGILPHVLRNGSMLLQARMLLTLGECEMSDGDSNGKGLSSGVRYLEQSAVRLEKLRCRELLRDVYYLLARAYHHMGEKEKRNTYSRRYRLASVAQGEIAVPVRS